MSVHEITVGHRSLSGTISCVTDRIRFLPVTMTGRFSNFNSTLYTEDRHELRVTGTKCLLPDTMSRTGKIFISGTAGWCKVIMRKPLRSSDARCRSLWGWRTPFDAVSVDFLINQIATKIHPQSRKSSKSPPKSIQNHALCRIWMVVISQCPLHTECAAWCSDRGPAGDIAAWHGAIAWQRNHWALCHSYKVS